MTSLASFFWARLPANIRYKARINLNRILTTIKSTNFLTWTKKNIPTEWGGGSWLGSQIDFDKLSLYLGTPNQTTSNNSIRAYKAKFFGFPVIGTHKIPIYLDAVVDLKLGIDPLLSSLGENVRRLIRRSTSTYDIKLVDNHDDINMVNRLMLIPYGKSRHGGAAVNMNEEAIHQLLSGRARGKLHVMYRGGEAVGCHLGYETTEKRGRVWNALRFGYVSDVFNDPKLLDEVNTLNAYLAMCWAFSQGYEFYNFGMSCGNLSDGLLRWKMRRGGVPDVERMVHFFYLKIERSDKAYFFWQWPMLLMYKGELCLCIGQPSDIDFIALVSRYKGHLPNGLRTILLYRAETQSQSTQQKEFFEYIQSCYPSAKILLLDR